MHWVNVTDDFFSMITPIMTLSLDGDSRLCYDLIIEHSGIGKGEYTFDSVQDAFMYAPMIIQYAENVRKFIDQSDLHLL